MRLLRRKSDVDESPGPEEAEPARLSRDVGEVEERTTVVENRWTPVNLLIVLAGAALAVVGIVGLSRVEIDGTWYSPVEQIGAMDYTPLLAAGAVGVGAVLVLLGIAGARALTAFVLVVVAVGAAVAAVDPGLVERELAIERTWSIALAAGAGVLALLSLLPSPAPTERRRRASTFWRRGGGRAAPQH